MSITNIVYLVNVCVVKNENNDEYNRTLQKSLCKTLQKRQIEN